MACYTVALQRVTHKLTIEDVRKLNIVTKKVKSHPITIVFKPLKNNTGLDYLTVFSDAGFKKEELDGCALRGAAYIRHKEPLYTDNGAPVGKIHRRSYYSSRL